MYSKTIDKEKIQNIYGLEFIESGSARLLRGEFRFSVVYDFRVREYIRLDPQNEYSHPNFISDSYFIEIDLSKQNLYRGVKEVGGKIMGNANRLGISSRDLHMYDEGLLCVAGYLDEIVNIELEDFLGDVVLPFFYDQSYYSNHHAWPRGEYSHGHLGLLENYYEKIRETNLSANNISQITEKCLHLMREVDYRSKHSKKLFKLLRNKKSCSKKIKIFRCPGCRLRNNFYNCIKHDRAYKGFIDLSKNMRKYSLKSACTL